MTIPAIDCTRIDFSDMRDLPGWELIEGTCGSDYSGSSITRANFEWFVDNLIKDEDIKIVSGMFFGYGIAYNTKTEDPDLLEVINCIESEGCIDDTYVYQVEARWIDEAMDDAIHDFRRASQAWVGYDEYLWDDIDDEFIGKVMTRCMELANETFIMEYSSAWLDVNRLVPYTEQALKELAP